MKDILTSIRRAPYQSLAAFLVLFFTLLLTGVLFLAMNFLYGLLGYVETRPQVTVYFQTKTSESAISKLKSDLQGSDKIETIQYVSKEQAFKNYKQWNKNNPLLLEMVSSDILPASLEIYAKKPDYLPQIADLLKKKPGIDEVVFQQDILKSLLTLTSVIRTVAMGFFVFLIAMSIIVLTTTTLFKIALKKDEIELLRFIGATRSYIRRPFLGEAMLFGLAAAGSSFILILAIMIGASPFMESYLATVHDLQLNFFGLSLPVWPLNLYILGLTFVVVALFGMIIATISTFIATKKYLT